VHDPELVALRGLFVIVGVISAYYLVEGLREGRFPMRYTFGLRQLPFRNGRDPCYIYRDNDAVGFWVEASVQLLAVAVSIVVFCVLLMVP
jgi:hypothetical protein